MKNYSKGKINWRFYIIAYLDVMGQKEAFKNIASVPKTKKQEKQLIQALKKTYTFIGHFRNGFQKYFEQSKKSTGIERNVPKNMRHLYKQMMKNDIHFSHFSDFVIPWTPLETKSHSCVQLNSILGIMSACASMVLLSLYSQHAIRGGIEVEAGLELDSGEPYGPVLNKAYTLESKVADYPRIIIGNGLINYLQVHKNLPGQDVFSKYTRELSKKCLNLIKRDLDGFYFLDWLSEDIEQHFNDVQERQQKESIGQILKGAARFISIERERFISIQDTKLVGRYTKLGNYFHSRVKNWKAWINK